jgi:HK97 family phage prohead protease
MSAPMLVRTELGFDVDEDLEAAAFTRQTFVRTVEAELVEGDGRTLDMRVVPYGVEAVVADPPSHIPYREMFVRGAFERQLAAPNRVRVWLNFEHEQGLRGIVGHGLELSEDDRGLHGSFRVHENTDGDKALALVRDRILSGISAEFVAIRSRRVDGVVQRLRAHLDKVSLCRSPAYAGAEVLAVRELDPAVTVSEAGTAGTASVPVVAAAVPAFPDELAGRLAELGVEPLERMATTASAWDGSPARFTDDQYRRSALLCRGSGSPPKQDCSLPVLEPDGTLNVNALGAAAAALAGGRGGLANVTAAQRAAAARRLVRYYNAAKRELPASLVALARS